MTATNTKERSEAIAAEAQALVAEFGIERLDAMSQAAATAQRLVFARQLAERVGCHRETARVAIAKACRRLRNAGHRRQRHDTV